MNVEVDPLQLLRELEVVEGLIRTTGDPAKQFMLLRERGELLGLLVVARALLGFRCERLERIIATEPEVSNLLREYEDHDVSEDLERGESDRAGTRADPFN